MTQTSTTARLTWRVVERKLTWHRNTRRWTRTDTVLAEGLSQAQADCWLYRNPSASAEPEVMA